MNRKLYWLITAILLALIYQAEAQQPAKIPRIGYVAQRNKPTVATPDLAADSFQEGLRTLGYIEGKNVVFEYRYAEGSEDRLRALIADLVQLKVDVIVSPTFQAISAA